MPKRQVPPSLYSNRFIDCEISKSKSNRNKMRKRKKYVLERKRDDGVLCYALLNFLNGTREIEHARKGKMMPESICKRVNINMK